MMLLFTYTLVGQTAKESFSLKVTNIKNNIGHVIISIYDHEDSFPNDGLEIKKLIIPVKQESYVITEIDLPKGEYAIALLHDENNDGECNFNMLGIPTEGYGFSQNIRPLFSIPEFEETKFEVTEETSLEIELIH